MCAEDIIEIEEEENKEIYELEPWESGLGILQ